MTRQSLRILVALILFATQLLLSRANSSATSTQSNWPPSVLLDDFNTWNADGLNSYGLPRSFSVTAQTGTGFITLDKDEYYNACYSTGERSIFVDYIALRIFYSAPETVELGLQLIHLDEEKDSDAETTIIAMMSHTFIGGDDNQYDVPIVHFVRRNSRFSNTKVTALKIPGPLTVHRVEIVISEESLNRIFGLSRDPINLQNRYHFLEHSLQLVHPNYKLSGKPLDIYFEELLERLAVLTNVKYDYIFSSDDSNEVKVKKLFSEISLYCLDSSNNLFEIMDDTIDVLKIHQTPREDQYYQIVGYFLGMAIANRQKSYLLFNESIYKSILDNPDDITSQVAAIRQGILEIFPQQLLTLLTWSELEVILSGRIYDF